MIQTSARHGVAEQIDDARSLVEDGRETLASSVEGLKLDLDKIQM